jgi:hypothetical protein
MEVSAVLRPSVDRVRGTAFAQKLIARPIDPLLAVGDER